MRTVNAAFLVTVVAAALALLTISLNQIQARIGLLEVTLAEGLPPGHAVTTEAPAWLNAADILEPGIHLFLSRTCHACQRLMDELDERPIATTAPVHLNYVDRPRPLSREVASRLGATLSEERSELATGLGADPLPYTIAVGDHALVARGVSPTTTIVMQHARDAGHTIERRR